MSSSHVDDIFGDNDEDDFQGQEKTSSQIVSSANDDFDIFESDDDADANVGRKKVLGAKKKLKRKTSTVVDSSDEEPSSSKKIPKKRNKEKSSSKFKQGRDNSMKKKAKIQQQDSSVPREGSNIEPTSSGDEYDSGEEVVQTKEDRNFIAAYDDNADIMDEYEHDEQIFDDEKPLKGKGKAKRTGLDSATSGSGETSKKSSGEKAILEQILGDFKGKKPRDLTDSEKERIVDGLKLKMEVACRKDEEAFALQRPALLKFQMLSTVEQTISMKALQEKLLDRNILGSLIEWIEPKKDPSKTLPSLAVRNAIYKLILHLPVNAHHLTQIQRAPLGKIINSLRKHPLETEENKRTLKEIAEKWSRIISGKSDEVISHNLHSSIESNPSLVRALAEKYSVESSPISSGTKKVDLTVASGMADTEDGHHRARVPINYGYLFTVQPAERNLHADTRPDAVGGGEKHSQLRKIIGEGRSKTSSGKKINPRAITVSVSGNGN